MRAKLVPCILLVLSCAGVTRAQAPLRTDAEVLAQAQSAFTKGVEEKTRILQARPHFSEAANAYRVLHQRGVRNPTLYLNLGNAALLADRWPEAIWAYHLGLQLDPNDGTLREHLAFARAKVIYPPTGQGRLDTPVWPTWLHRPTIYELFFIGCFSYILACLTGTGAYLTRATRLVLLTATMLLVALITGVGLAYELTQNERERAAPLVVLAGNTEFYRGNASTYPQHPVLPILPRGLEVRQLHRRGDWLQIRLSTGETGWVHVGNTLIVEP